MNEPTKPGQQPEENSPEAQAAQGILDFGSALTRTARGNVYCLTIIGQIEGHNTAPNTAKTTKYEHVLPLLVKLQEYFPKAEVFPMSALTKDGLGELKKIIVSMMPEGASQFPEDQLSTAPTRFLAAEIVREKVFERLRQEVPYTTAVDIESWEEEPERDLTIIHAVIFVQRPSHKAMVIGRAGSTIKEIGTEARRDIQNLIGGKVHLQLFVKVKDNWAEDTELLHDLGLQDE